MDTLSPQKNSKQSSSSSSGCSASSSTTDIKNSYKSQRLDNKPTGLRSRSFLHCLSKHLGRHFIHHHSHHHHHTVHQNGQTIVYNSQEELRSSSTDSFSLSCERNSRLDGLLQRNNSNGTGTSSFDISSEERTSRASSTSACSRFSPEQEDMENGDRKCYSNVGRQHHIYVSSTIYRPTSSLDCHDDLEEDYSESDSGNSSSEENAEINLEQNQENIYNQNLSNSKSKSTLDSSNLTTTSAKSLHLSRISITSSVRSIFQHISSVSASSTRSLSCSSTPLKKVWDSKCKKSNSVPASSTNNSGSNCSNSSNNKSNKSSSTRSSNSNTSNSSASKKTEKKQQSILRPPVNYVYMKGMSGLYSRVPRYSVCCPYATQQWA